MKFSYYPGCTLKTKAQELEKYGLDSAKALGVELDLGTDSICGTGRCGTSP